VSRESGSEPIEAQFVAARVIAVGFTFRVGLLESYASEVDLRSGMIDPPSALELELLCGLARWHETENKDGSASALRDQAHNLFRICRELIEHCAEEVSEQLRTEIKAGLVRTQPGAEEA